MCFTVLQNEKATFQTIKNSKFKKSEILDFSKGVSPQFWSKIINFSIFLFQAKKARKMCCTVFQKEKTLFQSIKTGNSKIQNKEIFPKGLVHIFGQRLPIFPSFYFKQKKARKMCFAVFQKEKTPFQTINRKFKKLKNLDFPKGVSPWVWSNFGNFTMFLSQAKQGRKMCSTIFQKEKTLLQTIKTKT